MFETNTKIITFIANNIVGLTMILALLKLFANRSKNVLDDKILTLFGTWLKKGDKKGAAPPPSAP